MVNLIVIPNFLYRKMDEIPSIKIAEHKHNIFRAKMLEWKGKTKK